MPNVQTEPRWQKEYSSNQISGDPLAIIYNENQWKLSKVSPLCNLQYNALKLKQYASKIRQAVVSAIASSIPTKYAIQCEENPRLKYSYDDSNGIMITVTSTQDKNTKTKVVYAALLISWGLSKTLNGATHLPYLLERGEQRLGTAVKSTIQTIFDCNIQPFMFTQHQLLQFGFSFVQTDTSRSSDPFTLTYKTPQVDHKDKLNLTFDLGDVHIIWNGLKEEVGNTSELVNVAYQIIQKQIFYMITLDVTTFDLCEISLPNAEIKYNGLVKMKTPEIVNNVFMILNSLINIEDVDKERNTTRSRWEHGLRAASRNAGMANLITNSQFSGHFGLLRI